MGSQHPKEEEEEDKYEGYGGNNRASKEEIPNMSDEEEEEEHLVRPQGNMYLARQIYTPWKKDQAVLLTDEQIQRFILDGYLVLEVGERRCANHEPHVYIMSNISRNLLK